MASTDDIPALDSELCFPLPVVHLDLEALVEQPIRTLRRTTLFIFFAQGLPVGQVYAKPDETETVNLVELANRVVSPAVPDSVRPRADTAGVPLTAAVVICTRDRPVELARCLASFAKQTRYPDRIIVVDNAPRDEQIRLVAENAGVDYVREDRPGLDWARNTGVRHAETDIVAFTDDDVVLHERWLECLMAAFDAPEIMAVTGLVLPGELETQAQYIFETQWGFGRGYNRIDFDADFYRQHRAYGCPAWQIGAGASMAFRREIFERIGLFDERLDVGAAGCSGDSEYWNRILHHGFTCRYEPAATAFHFHRRSLDGLARQIRAYMSGHVAALLVQYQRTGECGNLRRIVTSLPHYYLRRILRRLRHGRTAENYMLRQELLGCIDGLIFYLKAARPAALRESK